MKIKTWAVNCNDAWLNAEGDDISGSYVKYKDHQEVVAALEAKCAALAAENAALKSVVRECQDYFIAGIRNTIRPTNEGYLHMRCDTATDETTATDAFLAEVRSSGLDEMAIAYRKFANEEGCSCNMRSSYNLTAERAESYAAYIRRQGAAQ